MPVGLSLSLRRFFRIERPFQGTVQGISEADQIPVPEGWRKAEHHASDLAFLHQSSRDKRALVWISAEECTVRFRDKEHPGTYFARDDFDGPGRCLEYVGISLRVLPRSWFRYRASQA